MPFSVDMFQLV